MVLTRGDFVRSTLASSLVSTASASPASSPASATLDSVRWGIIGLGDVTAVKSGPPFWKCEGAQLVAVMRRTPGSAAKWAERVPGECVGYDDLDKFLKHPALDAVYVATPPGAHKEVALRVAAAGKHCYIEKPVGRSGAETAAIASAFEREGLKLYTAYVSRAYERTAAVSKLLAEGAVGEQVTRVRYTLRGTGGARGMDGAALPWRLNPPQSGGGLVMDVGCHVVDRLDYWLGPLDGVSGSAQNRHSPNQPVEDYVRLEATIGPSEWSVVPSEGARVELSWDFAPTDERVDGADGRPLEPAPPVDELIIGGPRGELWMAAMSPSAPVQVFDADGKLLQQLEFEPPEHAAQRLVQSMTDELCGVSGARCPSRADNAVRTSRVLDVALGSYYGGREDEYWARPESWPGRPQQV